MRIASPKTPLLLMLGAGCAHVVDAPPPAARLPLIEAVLIAGVTPTPFRIGWIDSSLAIPVLPVEPADVQLDLVGPGGGRQRLEADPDSAGSFTTTLPVTPGATYQLTGTIAGRRIEGTTRIPDAFTIAAPATDTVTLVGPSGETVAFDYQWQANGAALVVTDSAFFPPGYSVTRVERGRLVVIGRPAGSLGPTLRLWALNLDADRYLYGVPAPATNLEGAFGVLGGGLLRRRAIRWQ